MSIFRRPNGIDLPYPSEITPREVFESRRRFIKQMSLGSIAGSSLFALGDALAQTANLQKLASKANPAFIATDKPTSYHDLTNYNNFYEFGTDKSDPAQYAGTLQTHPWKVSIEGEVKKPLVLDLDDLMKLAPLEDRVYRHRSKVVKEVAAYPCLQLLLDALIPDAHAFCTRGKGALTTREKTQLALLERPLEEGEGLYSAYMKVLDYVGGMTDNYAATLAREISGVGIL